MNKRTDDEFPAPEGEKKRNEGESAPGLQWVGDGRSQQTAIFFTNARSHLDHILSQQKFVRDNGIVGLRHSVPGDDRNFYDVWQTAAGKLWFKVPVDPDRSQTIREMEELLKSRRGSFAEFEARVPELQSENSSHGQREAKAKGQIFIGLRPWAEPQKEQQPPSPPTPPQQATAQEPPSREPSTPLRRGWRWKRGFNRLFLLLAIGWLIFVPWWLFTGSAPDGPFNLNDWLLRIGLGVVSAMFVYLVLRAIAALFAWIWRGFRPGD